MNASCLNLRSSSTASRIAAAASVALLFTLLAASRAQAAAGAGAVAPAVGTAVVTPPATPPTPTQENLDAATLKSYGFAPGVALISMFKAGVENASVDASGIVRVEEKSKSRAGGVLELHYFVSDIRKKSGQLNDVISQKTTKDGIAQAMGAGAATASIEYGKVVSDLAHGPTFVVELGDSVIRSVGLGYLLSWRDLNRQVDGTKITYTPHGTAYNLGLVAMCEPNVKVLGAGLQKNVKLPTGDAIRFDRQAHYGLALMASFDF